MKTTVYCSLFLALLMACVTAMAAWIAYTDFRETYQGLIFERAELDARDVESHLSELVHYGKWNGETRDIALVQKDLKTQLNSVGVATLSVEDQRNINPMEKSRYQGEPHFKQDQSQAHFVYTAPMDLEVAGKRVHLTLKISSLDYDQKSVALFSRLLELWLLFLAGSFLIVFAAGLFFIRPIQSHFRAVTKRLGEMLENTDPSSLIPLGTSPESHHYLEFEKQTRILLHVLDEADALDQLTPLSKGPSPAEKS